MAFYTPDYEYEKAKKLVEQLDDSENNQLIKYYIKKNMDWWADDKKWLEEYTDFFNKMGKLMGKSGPTIYG